MEQTKTCADCANHTCTASMNNCHCNECDGRCKIRQARRHCSRLVFHCQYFKPIDWKFIMRENWIQ